LINIKKILSLGQWKEITVQGIFLLTSFSRCPNTAEIEELSLRTPRPVATTE
jgi:hypothetical protein